MQNGAILGQDFIDIPVVSGGERGLLGMAFHPDYANNGAFYVYYTCLFGGLLPCPSQGALTVTRFLRSTNNANRADPTTGAVILSILHDDADNHNGGRIQFGPDGHLYIGTGDGSPGGDQERYSQNRCKLLGKILRIAVDGGTSYTIPPDNPYAGSSCAAGTCPEIWSYGMRNPWKFAFDRSTGDLLIGDVGQTQVEEVDFEPWSSIGGRNYGWGVYEGNNCFNDAYGFGSGAPAYCYAYNFAGTSGACALLANYERPVITYGHNASGGFVITGGYRYRGANPALQGIYFYSDYTLPRIWGARPDRFGAWTTEILLPNGSGLSNPSTFGEDDAGELYIAGHTSGILYAIDGPPLTNVVSRKTHGGAGDFDFQLDTSRAVGDFVSVEPRIGASGGTSHLVVFQFSSSISSGGTASCVDANGNSVGTANASLQPGNEVHVTLDGIPDNQRVKVALANVNGTGIKVEVSLGFLAGDVDGSGAVTASDILRTKGRANQVTSGSNFVYDADVSSGVNSLDVDQVKVNAGVSLQ